MRLRDTCVTYVWVEMVLSNTILSVVLAKNWMPDQ